MQAAKRIQTISARPRTRPDSVSSPTVPGARESLQRVFDTVEWMFRRKQLDERSYRAALRVRTAQETLSGAAGNIMNPDRVRGASLPGSAPHAALLEAAETLLTLNDLAAKAALTQNQLRSIILIVCKDNTIEQTSKLLFHGEHPRKAREQTGKLFKAALHALAEHWWPEQAGSRNTRMRAFLNDDARPSIASDGVIEISERVYVGGRR